LPKFNIRGCDFDICAQDVELTAASLQPQPLLKLTHTVEIGGKVFPIRQLVAAVTGLPVNAVASLDAYKMLDKFGYFIQCRK